jgi:hypothetical protein
MANTVRAGTPAPFRNPVSDPNAPGPDPRSPAAPADPRLPARHAAGEHGALRPRTALPPRVQPAARDGLPGLHAEFAAAGHPGGMDRLAAVLSQTQPQPNPGTQPAREARDAAAALLQERMVQVHRAIGPGRDGAELAGLYGHDPQLDRAIDALRTDAATRCLLADEARRQGLADAAALPATAATEARAQAQALVAREREIAQTKLQIQRALLPQPGFVPALAGLRFTPELAQGLTRDNPAAARQAGVLMGALLAQENALAESPEGRRMLAAVQGQLQAGAGAGGDMAWLQRRAAALQPPGPGGALAPAELQRLGLDGVEPDQLPALLQALAERGLSGVAEIEHLQRAAGHTLARIRQDKQRLDPLGAPYQLGVDLERGRVLAGGLLGRAGGSATLQADLATASNDRIRTALTGPGGPLAAFAVAAGDGGMELADLAAAGNGGTPDRARLQALAAAHERHAQAEGVARAELLAAQLGTWSGPLTGTHRQALQHDVDAACRQMEAVVAQRREAMGPAAAQALQDALRAAALLTRPQVLQGPDAGEGLLPKAATAAQRLGQWVQTDALAQDSSAVHAASMGRLLQSWGLDPVAVGPEMKLLLAQPLDTARVDRWFSGFAPTPGLQDRWNADLQGLAGRLQPGGARHLASASLQRFMQGLDTLEPGTLLAFDLKAQVAVTTGQVPLPVAALAGVSVILSGQHDRHHQVEASRDTQGCQLVLRCGSGGQGELGLVPTLGAVLGKLLGVQALAHLQAGGHRLDGVALRFDDNEAGRAGMKALLQRMLDRGSLDTSDLLAAGQVLPVVATSAAIAASAGVRLNLELPVAALSLTGAAGRDTLDLAPRLDATLTAGASRSDTTTANSRQQVREHETSFTARLAGVATPRLSLLLAGEAGNPHLPLPGLDHGLAEYQCKAALRDVREAGLVTAATERSVRVSGPAALLTRAVDQQGGPQLQALVAYLQGSSRPEHHALRQDLAALLKGAQAGDEVRVVWRIAPQVQAQANGLLQQARAAAAGQSGHATAPQALAHAGQLEAQARALLDDPQSYRLHALERVAHETRNEKTSGLLAGYMDGSNVNLGYLKWGSTAQAAHERRATAVVFDPGLVGAALQAAGVQGTAGPPQGSLTPAGGGLGAARTWGPSQERGATK